MANPNSYQAYKEVTPLGNGISEDMKYWNEDGYKRREEEAEKEKAKQEAQEKKETKRKNLFNEINKKLKVNDSRSKSLNELVATKVHGLKNEFYLPVMEVLSNPNRTEEQEFKARLKLSQVHEVPEKLNMIIDKIATRNAEYDELKKQGLVFEELDYEKLFRDGYEGMDIQFDDNMSPMVAYRDLDGDGIKDFETFEEITGAEPSRFKFQKKYNLDDLASKAASTKEAGLGYIDQTTGRYTKTTQTKEIKEEAVKSYARRTMVDEEGKATDVALSELRKRGLDVNADNVELVIEDFEKMIKDRSDKLYKESFNIYPVRSTSGSGKTEPKNTVSFGGAVTPSKGNWGSMYKDLDVKNFNSISVKGVVVPALSTDKGDLTDLSITNYTYDKQGRLVFDGYVQEEKTITKEEYDRIIAEAGDDHKETMRLMAMYGKIDGDKYVYYGAKRKVQAKVNPEDELAFSEALGETIQDTRARARKRSGGQPEDPKPNDNEKKEKPIFN